MQFSLQTLLLVFVVAWSSLAVFGMGGGIVVFVLTLALAIYVHRMKSFWSLLTLALAVLCAMFLIALLLPAVASAPEATRRIQCANQLKQLNLGLHNYQQANKCFPPAYTADTNGKPVHSWRALVMPFVEMRTIPFFYSFNEPWDGPHNTRWHEYDYPNTFFCPSDTTPGKPVVTTTSYVAVVGQNAAWPGEKPMRFDELDRRGETANTVMLIEVANSGINWTEPRDLSLDALDNAATLPTAIASVRHEPRRDGYFFFHDSVVPGVNVAMADGSVHFLPTANLTPKGLYDLLQIGGFRDQGYDFDTWPAGPRHIHWTNCTALAIWLASVGVLFYRAVRSRKSTPHAPREVGSGQD